MNTEEKTYKAQEGCLATVGCIFLMALLTVAFFWPILTEDKVFWGDVVGQDYPWRNFAATHVRDGDIPLWNPYNYSGMPFLADVQSAVLYPLNLALAFFVESGKLSFYALQCQIIIHFFMAGLFMFILLRHLRLMRISALIGGISFMFTGFLVAHLGHVGMLNVAVWTPLIFMFFHKALTERRWTSSLAGGFFFGVAILAGHSQPALYLVFAMTLYLLYTIVIEAKKSSRPLATSLQLIWLFALMMVATFAVGAAQILPMSELTQYSVRANYGYEHATSYSLPINHLITLLIPKFYGAPNSTYYKYWGADNFTEMCIYAGLAPLILACIAICCKRNRETIFFLCLIILALFLALGKYTFVYRFIYQFFPMIAKVRVPARFGFLIDFSIPILAGFGTQVLMSPIDDKTEAALKKILTSLAVVADITLIGLFILYGFMTKNSGGPNDWKYACSVDQTLLFLLLLLATGLLIWARKSRIIPFRILAFGLIATVSVDLFLFGSDYNLSSKRHANIEQEGPVVTYLKKELGEARFERHQAVAYNVGTMREICQIAGWNPFSLNYYERFRSIVSPNDRLRYLLGVKMISSHDELAPHEDRVIEDINFDTYYMEQVGPNYNPEFEVSNFPTMLSDGVAMISELGYAVEVPQGRIVADLMIETLSGRRFSFPIRAGIESSDWACDYNQNIPILQHKRARVAYKFMRGEIPGRTFFARFDLPELEYIKRIVVLPTHPEAVVNIYGFSLLDSQSGISVPISAGRLRFDREIDGVKIFRTRNYLPRALFVHEVEWAEDFEDAVEMVRDEAFSLHKKAILTEPEDVRPAIPLALGVNETVQISLYEPDEVIIRVDAYAPGVLVLSDVYYPGWEAYLDNAPVPIFQANAVMRAVPVPIGRHWVRMKFNPKSYNIGLIISLFALFCLTLVTFRKMSGKSLR